MAGTCRGEAAAATLLAPQHVLLSIARHGPRAAGSHADPGGEGHLGMLDRVEGGREVARGRKRDDGPERDTAKRRQRRIVGDIS